MDACAANAPYGRCIQITFFNIFDGYRLDEDAEGELYSFGCQTDFERPIVEHILPECLLTPQISTDKAYAPSNPL